MIISPRVVDLSHYDDVQDKFAGAVKMGIWGVINKVTQGVGGHDKSFNWRRTPANSAGLLYGAYHFIESGRIPEQADNFLNSVGNTKGLLLALDWEKQNGRSPATYAEAKQWMQIVHDKVGRWPKFYVGGAVRDQMRNSPIWKDVDLWQPQYGPRPNKCPPQWPNGPWLWQYTGDGLGPLPHTVLGIKPSGKLDINHYPGTREELARDWAS